MTYQPQHHRAVPAARGHFVDRIVVGPDSVRVERTNLRGAVETLWAWQALTAHDDYVLDDMIEEARARYTRAEIVHEIV